MKFFLSFTLSLTIVLCMSRVCNSNESMLSDFDSLRFSLWMNYDTNKLETLESNQTTDYFKEVFRVKLSLVENRRIKKIIIPVLNPRDFPFFSVNKFDDLVDDNFYFWACKLNEHTNLEVVFDSSPFEFLDKPFVEKASELLGSLIMVGNNEPSFDNLENKLAWVSFLNNTHDELAIEPPIIQSIVVNPVGISNDLFQKLINSIDRYKHNCSKHLPANKFSTIKTGAVFNLDQKDLVFANLSKFPVIDSLRTLPGESRSLSLCPSFPKVTPTEPFPQWRDTNDYELSGAPLLDIAYVSTIEKKLVQDVFQNPLYFDKNSRLHHKYPEIASRLLSSILIGEPVIKGPGFLDIKKGTAKAKGKYTFFKTGTINEANGALAKGGVVELRPPYLDQVQRRKVSMAPTSNKELVLDEPFDNFHDIRRAEYYYSPILSKWNSHSITNKMRSSIHFIFCTSTESKDEFFMGNWDLSAFIRFFYGNRNETGFFNVPIFKTWNGSMVPPSPNAVLYETEKLPWALTD